ncbi:uncharacterized protein EDB91DRAFT_1083781 [Suillus paluster]|uniref:uncharacterized protein n=1 Tax=Suillus paluster TaxID=48578 RepID=UPI001B880D32|nr:uncharacterized protein EDB91DRAFT_1083781 [Suillus paluster]KAG1735329.1 hypothetical protein EDB91DRAFT_1083781 [Suillus paluster]
MADPPTQQHLKQKASEEHAVPVNGRAEGLSSPSSLSPHPPVMFQHTLSMQRRPDGAAGAPAEKPVGTAQGVQNINPHPVPSSPLVPNDPFIDTVPDNRHSGFNPSGLGLYGEGLGGGHSGGHGMYDFGGSQQNGPGLNQMRSHQFDQPPSGGYNPHMTPYSDPGSRGHSVPPTTPMMGDHPSLRGYSVPPTPSMQHTPIAQRNDSMNNMIQSGFQQLLTEMQKFNTRLTGVESSNQIFLGNQQALNEHAQQGQNMLKELLDAMTASGVAKSTAGKKNISNQHPVLKPIIQPIFFELCGIDMKTARADQTELLAQSLPLANGDAYETVDGIQKWFSVYGIMKQYGPSTYFVMIPANSPASRYEMTQISSHVSAEKTEKLTIKQKNACRRGRRQTAANRRREAVPDFEKSYGHQGSVALIDTDYGSDYVSYDEGELSPDSVERCKDQSQGKGSRKVIGLEWRSSAYIAFLRVLDEIHRCRKSGEIKGGEQDGPAEPSAKRRKIMKPKDVHKATFEAHPSQMSSRLLKSGKSTVLFNTMVNAAWLDEHKEVKVVEGAEWLKDFNGSIHEGDLAVDDKKYLDELAEWYADEEDNGN